MIAYLLLPLAFGGVGRRLLHRSARRLNPRFSSLRLPYLPKVPLRDFRAISDETIVNLIKDNMMCRQDVTAQILHVSISAELLEHVAKEPCFLQIPNSVVTLVFK